MLKDLWIILAHLKRERKMELQDEIEDEEIGD